MTTIATTRLLTALAAVSMAAMTACAGDWEPAADEATELDSAESAETAAALPIAESADSPVTADLALAAECNAPRLHTGRDWGHGGNLFERLDIIRFGGACNPCFRRDTIQVTNEGNGACWFAGWATDNPNDCTANVAVRTSGGFANGICHVRIFERI